MHLMDFLSQIDFAARRLVYFPLAATSFRGSQDVPLCVLERSLFPLRCQAQGSRWVKADEVRLWAENDKAVFDGNVKRYGTDLRLAVFVNRKFVGLYISPCTVDSIVSTGSKEGFVRYAAKLRLPEADLSVCFWKREKK